MLIFLAILTLLMLADLSVYLEHIIAVLIDGRPKPFAHYQLNLKLVQVSGRGELKERLCRNVRCNQETTSFRHDGE